MMNKALFFLLFLFCSSAFAFTWGDKTRVAFYYKAPIPEELHAFNVVITQPEPSISPQAFNQPYSQLYAYVSIGELDSQASKKEKINPSWKRGTNANWNSVIMDLSNPGWRDFLLNRIMTPLWDKGYRGFFLDTMDSYQLLKLSSDQKKQQEIGIVDLIKKIKKKYPQAQIIVNRGFEVMNQIHSEITAVAAESLFASWESSKKRYQPVSEKDRAWLLAQLNKIHDRYQLPIIVIDYVPCTQRSQAQKIAQKIKALGFIPWVSEYKMETLGIGSIEVMPRKVLVVLGDDFGLASHDITALDTIAFPLEYLGYIPIFQWTAKSFPQNPLNGEYAGIIAWLDRPLIKTHATFQKWVAQQIAQGIPIVFIQNFGFSDPAAFKIMGIKSSVSRESRGSLKAYLDKTIGYEITPAPNPLSFFPLTLEKGKVLAKVKAENGESQDAVAITPWGGYALEPYAIVSLPNGQSKWTVNPFDFFREALRLPQIPILDATTANGRRILTIHVDGDSFISKVPWADDQYAGELMLKGIFSQYSFPTTVSLIQREFELIEPAQEIYKRLIKTAQSTFLLPWIHIATHTYSHPLGWQELVEGKPNTQFLSYPVKGYLFSYEKEIKESTEFINQKLAPNNKKVTAVFWPGDGNVKEKPIRLAYENSLKNINGFAKVLTRQFNSITNLNAYGRLVGKYLQIYSPIPNDFQYTQEWSPPYYAFEQVIHTFELTDKPHRYKPISIYYHFYSAVEQASFRALKRIYQWAATQPAIALYVEDYIDKVEGFYKAVIAKSDDSSWLITHNGSSREIRSPQALGFPDLEKSKNVIGFNGHNDDYYIHLGNETQTRLSFTQISPRQPYLSETNAHTVQWNPSDDRKCIEFLLEGYAPLSFRLSNVKGCQVKKGQQLLSASSEGVYSLKELKNGKFEIRCAE